MKKIFAAVAVLALTQVAQAESEFHSGSYTGTVVYSGVPTVGASEGGVNEGKYQGGTIIYEGAPTYEPCLDYTCIPMRAGENANNSN